MNIDEFDLHVLDQTGNAKDIMQDLYGKNVSLTYAEKQLAGIRVHLKYKQSNRSDDILPVHRKYKVEASGVQVREKLVLLSEDDMQDPTTILRKMGLDPVQWELLTAEFDAKSWDVTMKLYKSEFAGTHPETGIKKRVRLDDVPHKETNWGYSCKIRVRPTDTPITLDVMRGVFEGLKIPKHKEYKYIPGDLMWEMPLMDIHFGKQSWADETGEDHYDINIADRLSRATVEDFLGKAGHYDKILFPIGQDFFHIDNIENSTTAGTRMDVDGRWEKIFDIGTRFLYWTLNELRRLAPVDVFYVPGNHDKMLSYCAVQAMSYAFKDTDSVIVDLSPAPRKYRQFGLGMVGFSHGKEGKRIEKLMQVEQPEMWGNTRFREFHLGDLHHELVWEDGGITFRRIPTITATDAWHNDKGFKGAIRKAQAFEWDKNLGIVNIHNSVVT